MMRPVVAISALVLTLGVIQPGHAAAIHAGAAVKADIGAVTGDHIVKAQSRRRLRSGRGFGHRRFGGRRGGFRHGRRNGRTRFFLSLAFPLAYFAYGPYNYYGGHNHGHGVIGGHGHGGPGSYGPGRAGYSAGCRAVSKIDHDRLGRWAKFGGTMCYDRFGNSYIVPESRHVIRYY